AADDGAARQSGRAGTGRCPDDRTPADHSVTASTGRSPAACRGGSQRAARAARNTTDGSWQGCRGPWYATHDAPAHGAVSGTRTLTGHPSTPHGPHGPGRSSDRSDGAVAGASTLTGHRSTPHGPHRPG